MQESRTNPEPRREHTAPASDRVHLGFLDGIRGLSALFVLYSHLHHQVAVAAVSGHHSFHSLSENALSWIESGRDAVSVFIVLSGFSLMLPLARSGAAYLRGGAGEYLQRRARRILPAYYATVVLSTAFTCLSHLFKVRLGIADRTGDLWAENVKAGALLSHALLVHNWSLHWIYTVEPALWSVAVEWQIYFFLPFLFLPLWRRFGMTATVGIAFLIGMAPHFVLPRRANLDWSAPWFLGLFALGMLGSMVAFSSQFATLRKRLPWGVLTALSALLTYGVVGGLLRQRGNQIVMDLGIGVTTMCLIVYCAVSNGGRSLLARLLASPPAVWLGACSYSIYLTHGLLITRLATYMGSRRIADGLFWSLIWSLGMCASVLFGFAFHLLFERPFMTTSQRRNNPVSGAA
jgi:peptidoglycan/LPS O-acetylase OafA/YrhL